VDRTKPLAHHTDISIANQPSRARTAPRDEAKDQPLQQSIAHLRDAAPRQHQRLRMFAEGEERGGGIGATDEDAVPLQQPQRGARNARIGG